MSESALPMRRPDASVDWLEVLPCCIGEIRIMHRAAGSFTVSHRDDTGLEGLAVYRDADAAIELARYDDAGRYRSLKTAPNLRHGWLFVLDRLEQAREVIEHFYPGRAAAYQTWRSGELRATPLRETLGRQTGIYRASAKISERQADELVGTFCRSDGGCLRTLLWKRDAAGASPSSLLPKVKFDPEFDQTGRDEAARPLLCQEACNLLVAAARNVVKGGL